MAKINRDIINYTGTGSPSIQYSLSPVALLTSPPIKPLFIINSAMDHGMPYPQIVVMENALNALGITNYKALTIPGGLHEFEYWTAPDGNGSTVGADVISWLESQF